MALTVSGIRRVCHWDGADMLIGHLLRYFFPAMCCLLAVLLGLNTYLLIQNRADVERHSSLQEFTFRDAIRLNTSEFEKFLSRSQNELPAQHRDETGPVHPNPLQAAVETMPDAELSALYARARDLQVHVAAFSASVNVMAHRLFPLTGQLPVSGLRLAPLVASAALKNTATLVAEEAKTRAQAARQSYQFRQTTQATLALAIIASALGWIWNLIRRNANLREDCRKAKERADLLERNLHHDAVTGLINRSSFTEKVSTAQRLLRPGATLTVLTLDLKDELPRPDMVGQAAEDAIFIAAADLLRHAVDTAEGGLELGRGADKNFLVLAEADKRYGLSGKDFAARLQNQFLRPLQTEAGTFMITPAVGYAVACTDEISAVDLVRNAGLAVAQALETNTCEAIEYQSSMRSAMERRYVIENALASAIRDNEFLPHFQPQIDLRTGRIFGVEALARWYHPQLGWISPCEFIPIAESNGDIVALGWKILESACMQVKLLPAELSLSVNLSVAQIHNDDVVAMIEECFARTGLPASRLKLEVTETTMMSDLQRIRTTLADLRNLGIGISLDDFGVGYSALSYLTDFHWDEIKIDRSFAAKAVSDGKLRDVLKLVLGIAEKMGSEILIEGIETLDQRDVLVEMGCIRGQGYLFGGPMAIDDIMTLFFPQAKPA
ncbi:GGDEF domain-containing protein [Rhodobacterales bacterium]|nr:GGDEF domain-containing protein [Rhodobacterales bacterium]